MHVIWDSLIVVSGGPPVQRKANLPDHPRLFPGYRENITSVLLSTSIRYKTCNLVDAYALELSVKATGSAVTVQTRAGKDGE